MIKAGTDAVAVCGVYILCFAALLAPAAAINYLWYRFKDRK